MQAQHFLAKVCKFLPSYTVPHPGGNPSIYLKVSEPSFQKPVSHLKYFRKYVKRTQMSKRCLINITFLQNSSV